MAKAKKDKKVIDISIESDIDDINTAYDDMVKMAKDVDIEIAIKKEKKIEYR
jgi:hypothetical protein